MRSTRIGILGGAFDPPHFMHRDMSKLVIAKGIVDEVWLMPCYSHPHNKKMAPARDRAFMCTLLLGNNPDPIGVSFLEIEHKLSGRTNEMWDVLQKQPSHKTQEYFMIIGQDRADTISNWHIWEWLIVNIPFIVVCRGENPPANDAWYRKPPHQLVGLPSPVPVSSTAIRERIRTGLEIQRVTGKSMTYKSTGLVHFIPEDIYKYIQRHRLYRS